LWRIKLHVGSPLRPFWLRSCVVVRDFNPDFAGIFTLAAQRMPQIILPATGDNDLLEIDPSLSNDIGLLVIIED